VDPVEFFTAARLAIVAGKGGVGKTTVSAVMARAAADCGLRTLVVELEQKTALGSLLGRPGPLPYDEVVIASGLGAGRTGEIRACTITPPEALRDYLDSHGLARITRRLVSSGVVDIVATGAPGIDDILVLGKLKQLERDADHVDLIIVDGPAAGHAVTFLQAAAGLADAVSSGPVATQARDVLELLQDPSRCQVFLVTVAETTPVNELIETAFALEDRVGVQLGPVVVNGVDLGPPLPDDLDECLLGIEQGYTIDGVAVDLGERAVTDERDAARRAARFVAGRRARQQIEIERLANALPIPRILLPQVPAAGASAAHVAQMAAAFLDGIRSPGTGAPT
jgi:cellulose biosynthesis protein BcsQ